jgi:hypothetical protein
MELVRVSIPNNDVVHRVEAGEFSKNRKPTDRHSGAALWYALIAMQKVCSHASSELQALLASDGA